MKTRVLIDASPVTHIADGLSNYIIGIIKYLPLESFDEFDYTVLINPGLNRPELTNILHEGNFQIIEARIRPIGWKRDIDMFWFLKKYKNQFDLIHITSNNYPFSLKNGICTIHDLTFKRYFNHPKYSFKLATVYLDWVIRNCVRRSKAIIAVSHSTKSELIKWYGMYPTLQEKITVIHEGYEHLINENRPLSICEEDIGIQGPYLFYLGSFRVHKNIDNLLMAFKIAMIQLPPTVKLAICGIELYSTYATSDIVAEMNKDGNRVIFTGYLSESCKEEYFRNADALVLPSLSEGFGIPVLEAFYYNKPVLCSNTTSLPEVAGDAAIYFNPLDPNSIAKAIIEFYNSPHQNNIRIEKGKLQLLKFSWKKAAEETIELYKKYK